MEREKVRKSVVQSCVSCETHTAIYQLPISLKKEYESHAYSKRESPTMRPSVCT